MHIHLFIYKYFYIIDFDASIRLKVLTNLIIKYYIRTPDSHDA